MTIYNQLQALKKELQSKAKQEKDRELERKVYELTKIIMSNREVLRKVISN